MSKKKIELPNLDFIREYRGVEFIFTKELKYIEKFFHLWANLYKNDPKSIGFRDFCDDVMENYIGEGHLMQLMMKDGECIGGGRITVRNKNQNFLLPTEMELSYGSDDTTFLLQNLMPELNFENGATEVSRLALAPEYRGDKNFSGSLFFNFFVLGRDLEPRYLFVLTDSVRSRMYCQLMKKFAGLDGHIFKHLSLFNRTFFEGKKMQIVGWDKFNELKDVYADRS